MPTALAVGLGAALGAILRWQVGIWTLARFGDGFPWGTLTINWAGSLLIGLLGPFWISGRLAGAEFWIVGLLGGFTTFSAFSLESMRLIQKGRFDLAAGYIAASVIGGIVLAASGWTLAARFGPSNP